MSPAEAEAIQDILAEDLGHAAADEQSDTSLSDLPATGYALRAVHELLLLKAV